ncbi:MAG: hypothetical protein KGI97_02315, partial [Alphaproteobacteria bacterium]|nr:hypothetical protein [Alphaproteobacteria bacterium]
MLYILHGGRLYALPENLFPGQLYDAPEDLYRAVVDAGGRVSPTLARRFVHGVFYGAFEGRNEDNVERTRQEELEKARQRIRALDLDLRLNLYESIAQEKHPANLRYLEALNAELGLTREFYHAQAKKARSYFERDDLESQWHVATGSKRSFANEMYLACAGIANDREKQKLAEFLVSSYAAHCGRKSPCVRFIYDIPENQALFQKTPDGAEEILINCNTRGFQ